MVALLQIPTTATAQGPADALARGQKLLEAGKTREAIIHYRQLVEQYPTWADAQLGLGYAFQKVGQFRQAKESYERALKVDAREVRAMNNLAHLLIETEEDIPLAIRLLKQAVQLRPDFAAAWDNLGWAHYKSKDYGQATDYFKMALSQDPNNASAHYHRGLAYLRKEDYSRARAHFEKVVRLDPRHANAWISLGLTLQRMDKKSEAGAAYQRALALLNRKSPLGREVVRLLNSLGQLYSSPGGMLGSSDSVFAKYQPESNSASVAQPFANMDPMKLPESGSRVPSSQTLSTQTLPTQTLSTSPSRLILMPTAASNGSAPPPVGLPQIMQDQRAGRLAGSTLGMREVSLPSQANAAANESPAVLNDIRSNSGITLVRPERSGQAAPSGRTGGLSSQAAETLVKQDLVEVHLRLARLYEQHDLFKDAASEGQTVINLAPWSKEAIDARDLVSRLEGKPEADTASRIFGLLKLGAQFYAEHQIEPAILQYEKVLVLNKNHPIAFKNLAFLNLRAGRLDVAYEQAKKALEIEPAFLEALLIKGHIEARQRRFRDSYDTFRKLGELARDGTPIRQYAQGLAQKMHRFIELE